MEEMITFVKDGRDLVFWMAGFYALVEFFKWLVTSREFLLKKCGIKTKKMLEQEEREKRLKATEAAIEEIKDTSKKNVDMFLNHERQVVEKFVNIRDEIVKELNRLHEKMDAQKEEYDKNNERSRETDCVMLRDRIASGMRYFGQNKDEKGRVHISLSDYENMEALFQEYFSKNGNGAFKKMYEAEFQKFIIDR